ncbi:hypothetical protein GO730_38125 [Spirosoma sp. HMF3257]|uniref:Uncharacterized protein n=1 Tax=Spirosoma telluris TaxID=2183553 RepID=A0A327NGA7_9BACT|nr:hypothetical protein [Spirosoma telluris]MVM42139.1 hypothetical protein [Spirosoma telluris]RAI73054.1 hypothetical protein HMF3257_37255 [Spirosoma telluris]RAI73185.1 hypothetical protein HMF3257_38025 [Spirosoma telluris]
MLLHILFLTSDGLKSCPVPNRFLCQGTYENALKTLGNALLDDVFTLLCIALFLSTIGHLISYSSSKSLIALTACLWKAKKPIQPSPKPSNPAIVTDSQSNTNSFHFLNQ